MPETPRIGSAEFPAWLGLGLELRAEGGLD